MKLTKEQIEEIKKLRKEGRKLKDIAEQFNVTGAAIRWHTNEEFKNKFRIYYKKWWGSLSKEKKSEYFQRRKEYQRKYHKDKYTNDPEFRRKQKASSIKSNREWTSKNLNSYEKGSIPKELILDVLTKLKENNK